MRRKRVETYFALYLTAIIAFLVVASERDKVEEELRTKNEKILAAFLRSAPVEPERDTLFWNVDADDRTGVIRGTGQSFSTYIRIRDIRNADSASLALTSLRFNGDFLDPGRIVRIGKYYQEPNTSLPVVIFPVLCGFPRTGVYDLQFDIHTERIHRTSSGDLQYSDFLFSRDLIDEKTQDAVERGRCKFTVVVQDTSAPYPVAVEQIGINVARQKIVSAVGFEETNEIYVNLPGTRPTVRIVYGSGTIEQRQGENGAVRYFWRGAVRPTPDSVIVEARVSRGAGGKDVARTRFQVISNEPYLVQNIPTDAYAGEEFQMSLQVEGLNNTAAYSWTASLNGEKRQSGAGPVVRYVVPANAENAELTITGQYEGKTFRWVEKGTNRARESVYNLKIRRPPAHIHTYSFPEEATPLQTFQFDAVRYGKSKRSNERPIPYNDVDVEARTEEGRMLEVDVRLIQPGVYEFNLRNPKEITRTQNVIFTIRAAEAIEQETVRLMKK